MLISEKASAYLERSTDSISKDFPKENVLGVFCSPNNDYKLYIKGFSPDHLNLVATRVSETKAQIEDVQVPVSSLEQAHKTLKDQDGIGCYGIEFVNKPIKQLLRYRHLNLLKKLNHPYLRNERKKKANKSSAQSPVQAAA